jgi:hypothetical protein
VSGRYTGFFTQRPRRPYEQSASDLQPDRPEALLAGIVRVSQTGVVTTLDGAHVPSGIRRPLAASGPDAPRVGPPHAPTTASKTTSPETYEVCTYVAYPKFGCSVRLRAELHERTLHEHEDDQRGRERP